MFGRSPLDFPLVAHTARMRIHPRKNRQPIQLGPVYYANEQIRAAEVRLIGENAEHLGVMPTEKALAIAQERGYDLVEVSPKDNPPICKLLNFGQFKYEREREARKQKSHAKTVEVKGIRLSSRIGAHDLETRMRNAEQFLTEGHKVKVEIILRGREKAFAALARGVIENFIMKLREKFSLVIEQPVQAQGGQLTAIVAKK